MIPFIQKIGSLKKLLKIILVTLVMAIAISLVLLHFDIFVRPLVLPSVGWTIPGEWAVFVTTFMTLLLAGIVAGFLGGSIKQKAGDTKVRFLESPNYVQAIFVGLLFAIIAGASVGLTNVFLYALPFFLGFVVGGFVWIIIGFFTYRHLENDRQLGPWMTTLVLGTVLATVLALGTIGLDDQIRRWDFPGYAPLLVFLIGAAPSMYLIHRRGTGGGVVDTILVKTGMAQAGQLQTFTVGVAVGALVAVGVGFLVGISGVGFWPTAFSFILVWAVVTAATIRWFGSSEASKVLVIDAVEDRTSNRNRELSVRNLSDDPVDLRNAKIRDTENDLYRTNIQVVLGAGQTGKFDIPPGFSIEPTDDGNDPFDLGSDTDVPVIVTPDGEKYELHWSDVSGQGDQQEQEQAQGVGQGQAEK